MFNFFSYARLFVAGRFSHSFKHTHIHKHIENIFILYSFPSWQINYEYYDFGCASGGVRIILFDY